MWVNHTSALPYLLLGAFTYCGFANYRLRLIQEGEGRGVSHEILKYLRHTPIGLQALLNLRLTSRRVKNWVDRSLDYTSYGAALLPFPLHDGEDTAILVLQRFLRAPPPPWIISIIFDGQFPPDLTNSEDRTIWTQFLQIWKPKIRSLSVKKLELPLSRLEIDFLSAANLQVFKIQSVLVDLEKSHGIPHSFPPLCLMKISEFRLAESDHRFPVEDYLKILLKSSRVRIVQISASNRSELRLITRIIQRHNNDPGFLLQLKVNIIENPVRTKAAQECCASIINSECVVEIYDAMPPCLQWLISGLSPQNKSAILGRVKSIMGWQYTEAIPLSTMTNAEFLGNFNMDLAQWKESLPEKLKFLRLRITQELSFTLNLCPGSLEVVILEFTEEVTTSPYIRRIVTSLQVNCKRLRHLSLYLGRFVVEPELSLIRLDPIEGNNKINYSMQSFLWLNQS